MSVEELERDVGEKFRQGTFEHLQELIRQSSVLAANQDGLSQKLRQLASTKAKGKTAFCNFHI